MSLGETSFGTDMPATAATDGYINIGQPVFGFIDAGGEDGDADGYSAYLVPGVTYTVSVFGPEPVLEIRSPDGVLLFADDPFTDTEDTTLTFSVASAGLYLITVRSAFDFDVGLYTVVLTSDSSDDHGGDLYSGGTPGPDLSIGTIQAGSLEVANDADAFNFEVVEGQRYFYAIAANFDASVTLDDTSFQRLALGASGPGLAGTYTADSTQDVLLTVSSFSFVQTGSYSLLVESTITLDKALYVGTLASDVFAGSASADEIWGWDGADQLNGGSGADHLIGGPGDDVYFDDGTDIVVEVAGEGTDEVRTSAGSKAPPDRAVYVIPANVEKLTGTSTGNQGVRDNALDNLITMAGGHDLIVADAGGADTVNGGAGNDFIYYGDKWTAADITNGGSGTDTISLIGNYESIVFTATNLVGIERMAMYSSLYLPGTGPNNYNVTMNDANVGTGTEFFVTAASLQSNESLIFNGSAELGGRFTVHGGGGNDTITGGSSSDFFIGNAGNDILNANGGADFLIGGAGADQLRGGAGADQFRYANTAHSTAVATDHIFDFEHIDRIDLSAIDANGVAGDGNQAFNFIGIAAFGNVAGQLRAYQDGGDWFVEGDTNGDGSADLVIQVTVGDSTPLTVGDFIL